MFLLKDDEKYVMVTIVKQACIQQDIGKCNLHKCFIHPGGGGTDLERGYGDVRPWRPPFHASPAARKGPISSISSVQIKWSSGRPDAQNSRRTTWTSQQVIRGTTRITSPELEFDFENFFHFFWSASTFKIDGFLHYFPPLIRVIVVPESASQVILKGKEWL